jgi:acetyl esterase/lipase
MTRPDYLREFVLPCQPAVAIEVDGFDLYLPAAQAAAPVTILVHGGPMRAQPVAPPREWPVFRGYASALVARGVAAVMFDHALLRSLDYAAAAARLAQVVDSARAHTSVDADRVALWFFSGGSPLAAGTLRNPPPWLRTIALSYPMLQPLGQVAGFSPTSELPAAGRLPILLTRVGLEFADLVPAQDDFVGAARSEGIDLTVIEVPNAHHAFDVADDTDESRDAIEQALTYVQERLA